MLQNLIVAVKEQMNINTNEAHKISKYAFSEYRYRVSHKGLMDLCAQFESKRSNKHMSECQPFSINDNFMAANGTAENRCIQPVLSFSVNTWCGITGNQLIEDIRTQPPFPGR
jgi:hypothetical protein